MGDCGDGKRPSEAVREMCWTERSKEKRKPGLHVFAAVRPPASVLFPPLLLRWWLRWL